MILADGQFYKQAPRKIVVTGHYGSGKTEFSVSLAMLLAADPSEKLAIIDLDIVNPYFRSREMRDHLEDAGVSVYGSAFDKEVTAELPALGASLRAPLEDSSCRVIVDLGGNDSGAMILNQFSKYFTDNDTMLLAVINAKRPDTSILEGALQHIASIEKATGFNVSGIVNNSHLLRETTADIIIDGHKLCMEVCIATGKQFWCDCYPHSLVKPEDLNGLTGNLLPIGLYMRPAWLDRN